MNSILKTPFRYPGSKSSFTNVIREFIYFNDLVGCKLVEPYAGSAAVSLALVSEGICAQSLICERDPLMYSFWKVVFSDPSKLLEKIQKVDVTLDTWHKLKFLLSVNDPDSEDPAELAFAAIFFNRTNFSGVLHSGPIGGQGQNSPYKIDCRFNKTDLIEKITKISGISPKIVVQYGDAIDVIQTYKRRKNALFYIDPPYFIQGPKLYRHHYKLKDHVALAKALSNVKFDWILSYDNHDVIQGLYEKHNHVHQSFQYSTRSPKNEEELLITNLNIPSVNN